MRLGTVYVVIKENMEPLKKGLKQAERSVKGFVNFASRSFRGLSRAVFSLKGAFAGILAGAMVKNVLDIASGFDMMRLSLDTITKGKGVETFRALDEWALKMPVNTQKAIDSYIKMRAMGLTPTIEQMTIMVDTASALGKGTEGVQRISLALGQMAAKGKVSGQELMQLAEAGVPALGILAAKFGNVETSTIKAKDAIQALFDGMQEAYGGQSEKIQNTFMGLTESLKGYWAKFVDLVMQSGVMEWIEGKLKSVVNTLDGLMASGQLQAWAESTGLLISNWLDIIYAAGKRLWKEWGTEVKAFIGNIGSGLKVMGDIIGFGMKAVNLFMKLKNAMGFLGAGYLGFWKELLTTVGNARIEINNVPMITMSPKQPWKSGIAEMRADVEGVGQMVEMAFDASAIKSGLNSMAGGSGGGGSGSKFGVTGTARVKGGENYVTRFWAANQGRRIGAAGGLAKYLPYMTDDERFGKGMSFKSGTDYVPRTGPALLHEGEAVIPKNQNKRRGLSIGGNLVINVGQGAGGSATARAIRYELEKLSARGV